MRKLTGGRLLICASVVIAVAVCAVVASFFLRPHTVLSDTSTQIYGYIWSDDIGWISLNCTTGGPNATNVCSTSNYYLSIDNTTNLLQGYAWSDNIGWVSANGADTASCGSPAQFSPSTGQITGWLKALSADNNDWNGCISISGSNYGPEIASNGNVVSSVDGSSPAYSWGSENLGWLQWIATTQGGECAASQGSVCTDPHTIQTTYPDCSVVTTPCPAPSICSQVSPTTAVCASPSGTVSLTISPSVVGTNGTTDVSWNATNVTSCSAVKGTDGENWPVTVTGGDASSSQESQPIGQVTTFSISCLGEDGHTYSDSKTVTLAPVYIEQ